MHEPIDVYIGTGPGMELACNTLICSIASNTEDPSLITIHLMDAWGPDPEWCDWANQCNHFNPLLTGKGFWVTPFSLFRYAVPHAQVEGFAVYLDADMIMLGDIQELYLHREQGKWVCAENQDGDCVSIIDVDAVLANKAYPSFDELRGGVYTKRDLRRIVKKHLDPTIPDTWNMHDRYRPYSNLVHYTSINTQPWHPWPDVVDYQPHPNAAAVSLWEEWSERSKSWQLKSL